MKNKSFLGIDWKDPELSNEIKRPFVFRLEESLARAFIKVVQDNGLLVRTTLVKLVREFINYHQQNSKEGNQDDTTGESSRNE